MGQEAPRKFMSTFAKSSDKEITGSRGRGGANEGNIGQEAPRQFMSTLAKTSAKEILGSRRGEGEGEIREIGASRRPGSSSAHLQRDALRKRWVLGVGARLGKHGPAGSS